MFQKRLERLAEELEKLWLKMRKHSKTKKRREEQKESVWLHVSERTVEWSVQLKNCGWRWKHRGVWNTEKGE